jgi:hypothetical protein
VVVENSLDSGTILGQAIGMIPVGDPQQPLIAPIKIGNVQFKAVGLYSFSIELENQRDPIVHTFNVQLGTAVPVGPQ